MKRFSHKYGAWVAFALVLAIAPQLFKSNFALTIISQIGIVMISCLSFNLLLGEGGMLSFGHAVYTGMGGYFAVHALNAWGKGDYYLPVTLVPLVGGLGSLTLAFFLGFVSTRKSGTTFAMITLGTSELIASMALMFVDFFGGEAGVSTNRVTGHALLGITYGSQMQVYYLIAFYALICVALMYYFTKTPLGKLLNAVRDNPSRVEFIGYNTARIRWIAFMVSGFFAGVAGGLAAINFELVNSEVVGPARSGAYILFTYLGGIKVFFGPIIGALLLVLTFNVFSQITKAWLLYLGLIFFFCVIYLPGGIAGAVVEQLQLLKNISTLDALRPEGAKRARRLYGALCQLRALVLLLLIPFCLGVSLLVEMLYQLQLSDDISLEMTYLGAPLNPASPYPWGVACLGVMVSVLLVRPVLKRNSALREELTEVISLKGAEESSSLAEQSPSLGNSTGGAR